MVSHQALLLVKDFFEVPVKINVIRKGKGKCLGLVVKEFSIYGMRIRILLIFMYKLEIENVVV